MSKAAICNQATPLQSRDAVPDAMEKPGGLARQQVRSSTLLLLGRGLSLVLNFAVQIIMIRHLSKLEYGTLAFAFAMVELASLAAAFGMDKTLARFGGFYHEQGDRARLAGSLLFAGGVTAVLGMTLACVFSMLPLWITWDKTTGAALGDVLVLVALLIPINAVGSVMTALLRVFGRAGAVFFRKHVLVPGIKLAAVAGIVLMGGHLRHLAVGYLAASLCGALADVFLLRRLLKQERFWPDESPVIPWRDFLAYGVPILSSDVLFIARGGLVVILLGWLSSAAAAASFRAVLPMVRLNELVLVNFSLMFVPLASRLLAHEDRNLLGDMYRRSTCWTAVLTFPLFAVCLVFSRTLTVVVFGPEYTDAGSILAVLAVGYYIQAAFGFNARVLKVLGLIRPVVFIDLAAALLIILLCSLFISILNALGAAWAVSLGMCLHAMTRQVALMWLTDLGPASALFIRSRILTVICCLILIVVHLTLVHDPFGRLIVVLGLTAVMFFGNRRILQIDSTFPELQRIPWLHRLLTAG